MLKNVKKQKKIVIPMVVGLTAVSVFCGGMQIYASEKYTVTINYYSQGQEKLFDTEEWSGGTGSRVSAGWEVWQFDSFTVSSGSISYGENTYSEGESVVIEEQIEELSILDDAVIDVYYSGEVIDYEKYSYVGTVNDGKPDGLGTQYYYTEGLKYVGGFKDNALDGFGTYYYSNGDKFSLEFKEGLSDGIGVFYCADGTVTGGIYENGEKVEEFSVEVIEYEDGSRYEGEVKDGLPNGKGLKHYVFGVKYAGEFRNGRCDGFGTDYFTNGTRYTGEFKEGYMHGAGTFYYADGTSEEVVYEMGEKTASVPVGSN